MGVLALDTGLPAAHHSVPSIAPAHRPLEIRSVPAQILAVAQNSLPAPSRICIIIICLLDQGWRGQGVGPWAPKVMTIPADRTGTETARARNISGRPGPGVNHRTADVAGLPGSEPVIRTPAGRALAERAADHKVMSSRSGLRRGLRYVRNHWFTYALVLPGLCFLLTFEYGPMYGVQLAFKQFNISKGIWGSPWVGLDNFVTMVGDRMFWSALRNTVEINIWNLAFGFSFTVFLALMINEIRIRQVKTVVQTMVYLPYFLSWVIFAGLIMTFLSPSDQGGVVNAVIGHLGGSEVDFLKQPSIFQPLLVGTNILKTAGYSTIIYLAAISTVNPALYESAMIDGANRVQIMRHVTLPRILPSVAVLFLLQVAGIFSSNFDQVYNMYNSFVYSTGDVLSTYIYRNSIGGGGELEVSTAMNLLFNVLGLVAVVVANRFTRKLDVMGIF